MNKHIPKNGEWWKCRYHGMERIFYYENGIWHYAPNDSLLVQDDITPIERMVAG